MLKVQHITTGYGKKQVLTDVSFEVNKGEIVLLTGGNGSGKSTVLKTIYGLLKPWTKEGKIIFEDMDITNLPTSEMIKLGIVYIPQKKNVFEDFTVEENLLTSASIYSRQEAKQKVEYVLTTIPRLSELKKQTPFHMSGGEKQLLALGMLLIHSPKLMLLDEPLAGIDNNYSSLFTEIIKLLKAKEITFIIVEHTSFLSELVCEKIKIELGKLIVDTL